MAPSVTAGAHRAFPELGADRPYHQPVDVKGRITVGDHDLALAAAIDGIGPAFIFEDVAQEALASGPVVRILADWCPPFSGQMLYYPRQRRVSSALRAFIEMARHRALLGAARGGDARRSSPSAYEDV